MHFSLRIHLQNKEDGELLTVYPRIYDELNGLMNFPVELDKWNVLGIDRPSDVKDVNGKTFYEGDALEFIRYAEDGEQTLCRSAVKFKNGAFRLDGFFASESPVLTNELAKRYGLEVVEKKRGAFAADAL